MTQKRKPVSATTRVKVLERDGFRCRHCGATVNADTHNIDHVIPVRKGGSNDIDNLVTSCKPCNRPGRPALPPDEARGHITARLPKWQIAFIEKFAAQEGIDKTRALEVLLNRSIGLPDNVDGPHSPAK